jgi:Tn3 transposase DDE domain-containing protein
MQAVADALSLLANLVMAWNSMKMQSIFDRWNTRRASAVPPELIGRIAPTRTEGINLRGGDLSTRKLIAPPRRLLSFIQGLHRAEGFVALASSIRRNEGILAEVNSPASDAS